VGEDCERGPCSLHMAERKRVSASERAATAVGLLEPLALSSRLRYSGVSSSRALWMSSASQRFQCWVWEARQRCTYVLGEHSNWQVSVAPVRACSASH
jgi:hypothetical protein